MTFKRELVKTSDGSVTLYIPELNETYHSKNGAITESQHVFISNGLDYLDKKEISILEIGFGTGLNCIVTFNHVQNKQIKIHYTGVEAYPITDSEIENLNYTDFFNSKNEVLAFSKMHSCNWEVENEIDKDFTLIKQNKKFVEINCDNCYDLIYFDAFGPEIQPDLWTEDIFRIMYNSLRKNGVLTTYSAKGSVRRAMQSVGFKVERLPGPPGKREMLRAVKGNYE